MTAYGTKRTERLWFFKMNNDERTEIFRGYYERGIIEMKII
jgi:hypothetical protein